jgi:hypothetical protein
MPTIEVDYSVYCGTCGTGLCGDTKVDNKRQILTVTACSRCMELKDEEIQNLEEELEKLKEVIK